MKTGQCTRQFCISNVNHLESTFVPASNYVYLASAAHRIKHSFDLKATLRQGKREAQSNALLDCGAYSCFAHYRFVQAHGLELKRLSREVRVFNADATENKKGLITHYVRCQVSIGNHTSWQSFLVTDIGRQDLIIGITFLREHNPEIDWKQGNITFKRCPDACAPSTTPIQDEELNGIMPHLEDVAKDSYGELAQEPWDDRDQFIHWMKFSDDPQAHALRQSLEEKDEPLTVDRAYWSQHVPA